MSGTIPSSHIVDAQKLEADGIVELFRLAIYGGQFIRFKRDKTGTWQGNSYSGVALQMTGSGSYADQQVARPKLAVQNPDSIFSPSINQGLLERAILTRYRILKADYDANINIYVSQVWYVGRVTALTKHFFSVELRALGDNANFTIPGKTFSPPDFPSVMVR